MPLVVITENPELSLIDLAAHKFSNGIVVGQLAVIGFSVLSEQPIRSDLYVHLEHFFGKDEEVYLYMCTDSDVALYWRRTPPGRASALFRRLNEIYPATLARFEEHELIQVFETHTQSNAIAYFFSKKLANIPPEKKMNSKPLQRKQQTLHKCGFSEIQQRAFAHSLLKRKERKNVEVLVVEDQDFSRKMLQSLIQKSHLCHAASTATEALNIISHNAPNIVFLDVELPDINGHDLARFLRKHDPDLLITMVTGNNYPEDVERAKENKVQRYIIKPYTKEMILGVFSYYNKHSKEASA